MGNNVGAQCIAPVHKNSIAPIREIFKWIIVLGIMVLMYKFVKKDSLIDRINQNLPPREAAVMAAMITGDKGGFDKNFYEDLKNSGLLHLMVVSGSNVLLVTGLVIESLAWILGRKKTIVLGLVLAWGYAGLVGWEIPVVRAVLMATIMYWAQLMGRKYNVVRGLGLAVLIMIAGEPTVLMSYSFWLSVGAFLGVVWGAKWGNLGQLVIINLIVSPILWLMTGKINWISPVSNLLVLGITEIATLAVLITLLWGGLGMLVVYPLLRWLIWVVDFTGKF